jgi:uncharacterized protein (TIGR03067 family)
MRVGIVLLLAAAGLGVADKPDKKKQSDPVKEEMKKLEGSWTMVGMEYNGRTYPQQLLQRRPYRLVIKGNKYIRILNLNGRGGRGGVMERKYEYTFKVNPGKNPKAIDLIRGASTVPGIYQLDGDTLKVCETTIGGQRPTSFTTAVGSRARISSWKRDKR